MNKEILIAAGRAALDVLIQHDVSQQERDYAFLAGLLESGCVTITKNAPNKGYKNSPPSYSPLITFGHQNEDLVTWAHVRFNGSKVQTPPRGWEWRASGVHAVDILIRCRPYMIGKAKHVSLIIELQQAKVAGSDRAYQTRLFEQMKKLVKRTPPSKPLQAVAKAKNA